MKSVVPFGKASVKISGIRTITPTIMIWMANDTIDVHPRLVLSLPPDSIRLSSNIVVSPYFEPYVYFDTGRLPFAPSFYCSPAGLPDPEGFLANSPQMPT